MIRASPGICLFDIMGSSLFSGFSMLFGVEAARAVYTQPRALSGFPILHLYIMVVECACIHCQVAEMAQCTTASTLSIQLEYSYVQRAWG